jgi:hypothetical protein
MDGDFTEKLRRRQSEQEQAERAQVEQAQTPAELARHQRRAEKAGYLRRRLEEQAQAAREAGADDAPLLGG